MFDDLIVFFVKTIIITIATMILLSFIIRQKSKQNKSIKDLNKTWKKDSDELKCFAGIKTPKSRKKQTPKRRIFVIDFKGDIKPSQLNGFITSVNMILLAAQQGDEVLIKLHSPGGTVNGYGHAAYQLERLKKANLNVIVAIDQLAASGGYMIAAVANHIIASPFALIGSIGVVITTPNLHRLLDHNLIDFEQLTAGKYKRTLDPLTPNTEIARIKTQKDIEIIHQHFKEHILQHRPNINIDKVATGDVWLAKDALSLQLIDALQTADDYLLSQFYDAHILEIKPKDADKPWWKKLSSHVHAWLTSEPNLPQARMPQ